MFTRRPLLSLFSSSPSFKASPILRRDRRGLPGPTDTALSVQSVGGQKNSVRSHSLSAQLTTVRLLSARPEATKIYQGSGSPVSRGTSLSGERPTRKPAASEERIKSSRLRREVRGSEVGRSGGQEPLLGRNGSSPFTQS